jgi:oligopeptide transport system substrate-binding protein
VEQARRLLAEAGYPEGKGFPPIEFGCHIRIIDASKTILAQWQQNLGVEVKLKQWAWHEYSMAVLREPPPVCAVGWEADYPDPDNILRLGLGTYRTVRPAGEFLRLVEEAGRSTRQEERMRMYQEADRMAVEQALAVPMFYLPRHMLLKPWVKRYPTSPVREAFWKDVILEAH